MRLIGHLKNEDSARTFSGYLAALDIRNLVELDGEGWAVWIHSEDQIAAGQQALASYSQNPSDTKYRAASEAAENIERQRLRKEAKAAKRIHDRDRIWAKSNMAPLTLSLIGVCVLVTLIIGFSPTFFDYRWLAIDDPTTPAGYGILGQVRAGQVWRLITPIFVHMSPLHLIFNMFCLRDFGSMIELRKGTPKLAQMVLVLAVVSDLGQYFWDGPAFGGMSGVIYGLFGYIWLRGQCEPGSGLGMSTTTVWILMGWYVGCLTGLLGPVANAAHSCGLAAGALWGAAPMARRFFG
ncbi:MAG TPA: rhomboid family intramembrane serine protease [Verrucomicrobiae bacterium]|jgi:GlpG protein